jgi:hypothetical protein
MTLSPKEKIRGIKLAIVVKLTVEFRGYGECDESTHSAEFATELPPKAA